MQDADFRLYMVNLSALMVSMMDNIQVLMQIGVAGFSMAYTAVKIWQILKNSKHGKDTE